MKREETRDLEGRIVYIQLEENGNGAGRVAEMALQAGLPGVQATMVRAVEGAEHMQPKAARWRYVAMKGETSGVKRAVLTETSGAGGRSQMVKKCTMSSALASMRMF